MVVCRYRSLTSQRSRWRWLLAPRRRRVMSVLALLQINGVEVVGRTQAVVRMQGKMQNILQTMQGEGAVQVAEVRFHQQSFTTVDVAYELAAGRLQITKGKVGYGAGRCEVQGSLGLPPRPGTPGDRGVVTWHEIALEHTQQVQDFRSQGAATLHLRTTGGGQVELQVTPNGQLKGVFQGQTGHDYPPGTARRASWRRWKCRQYASPARCRPHALWSMGDPEPAPAGQGTAVELTNMHVQRTPSHIDLQGACSASLRGGELWPHHGVLTCNLRVERGGRPGGDCWPPHPRHRSY